MGLKSTVMVTNRWLNTKESYLCIRHIQQYLPTSSLVSCTWMWYPLMIPFRSFSTGGFHCTWIAVELMDCTLTSCGSPGTRGKPKNLLVYTKNLLKCVLNFTFPNWICMNLIKYSFLINYILFPTFLKPNHSILLNLSYILMNSTFNINLNLLT